MCTWKFEYCAGQYCIEKIDTTRGVAYIAPKTRANNASAESICEFFDELESKLCDARQHLDSARFAIRQCLMAHDEGYDAPKIWDDMRAVVGPTEAKS